MKTYRASCLVFIVWIASFTGCLHIYPGGIAQDKGPALHDVKGLIQGLPGDPCHVRVKGTFSKDPIKPYLELSDHIQGIAKIKDHYILAQSTGNNPLRRVDQSLLVSGDGRGKCSFHLVGAGYPHCGGVQACGEVLAVAIEPRYHGGEHHGEGSKVIFLNFADPDHPRELTVEIYRPDQVAGAAGLVYHEQDQCHYAVAYNDGVVDLYKSNGHPLCSAWCRFEHQVALETPNASGGGTNLLYEDTGKLYLAGLHRDGEGWEHILLSEIKNPGKDASIEFVLRRNLSQSPATPWPLQVVEDLKISDMPNFVAGFRWGGSIVVKSPTEIDVLAASRQLCHLWPLKNYAKVKWWTNDQWVRLRHEGAYIAKFYLSWTENGEKKLWKSGKKAVWYEEVIQLPDNAENVSLNAQAMTGLLGKWAWKTIIDQPIETKRTYTIKGTTLHPKWD